MLKFLQILNNPDRKKSGYVMVFLFFLVLSLLIFRKAVFSNGVIVGQDWLFPYTHYQISNYIERAFYTWTYDMNLSGVRNPFFVQIPFIIFMKLFTSFGFYGEAITKAFIVGMFALSGLSMYSLLKFLRIGVISSVVGGIIYITMPFFFNYAIMGWGFVLFSVGVVLPLAVIFFIKSVSENKILFSVICGLLYAIAILQSQTLVWFPMVFLALSLILVKDKKSFWVYLRSLGIIIFIALAIHSTWWPNLFINQDPGVVNSDLALDAVSQGMRARLDTVNILKGWGGLYNQFFEVTYSGFPKFLLPLSFLLPLMALGSLIVRRLKKGDIRISLIIIFLYMYVLLNLSPGLMAKIPLSNLIRDTARFTTLSSFALAVLASIFLDFLLKEKDKLRRIFGYFLFTLIILNLSPFFSGAITGEPQSEYDVRMRTYAFPVDYRKAEYFASELKSDEKAYYPPSGTNISVIDNPQFFDGFKEIKDPFRAYSPLPGMMYMSYNSMGKPTQVGYILDALFNKEVTDKSLMVMGMMNIKYIFVRKDAAYTETQTKNLTDMLARPDAEVLDYGKVKIFKNPFFLPHLYVPERIVTSSQNLKMLPTLLDKYLDPTSVLFMDGENTGKNQIWGEDANVKLTNAPAAIEYKKINTTKYRLVIHGAKDVFPLIFSDSFHEGWKLYSVDYKEAEDKSKMIGSLDSYKSLTSNEQDQASKKELSDYINYGLISTLGDNREKSRDIWGWNGQKDVRTGVEKYNIDFVSKNNGSTIQNDNLESGNVAETWFKTPIESKDHLQANGFANSWVINPATICQDSSKCRKNSDGTYDLDFIIEFWPQRMFYLGALIAGLTFTLCLVYIGICWRKDIILRKNSAL